MAIKGFALLASLVLISSVAGAQVAAPIATEATPTVDVRDVYDAEGFAGRAVTVTKERDKNGLRYFYSRMEAQPGSTRAGGLTSVESWTDPAKGPVKAIYRAQIPGGIQETVFDFAPGTVTITKRTPRSSHKAIVKLDAKTPVVLSQFNPFDVLTEKETRGDVVVFDPDAASGLRYSVELLLKEADDSPKAERVYRVSSRGAWSEIHTDPKGRFISMKNSKGQSMVAVELSERDTEILLAQVRN